MKKKKGKDVTYLFEPTFTPSFSGGFVQRSRVSKLKRVQDVLVMIALRERTGHIFQDWP